MQGKLISRLSANFTTGSRPTDTSLALTSPPSNDYRRSINNESIYNESIYNESIYNDNGSVYNTSVYTGSVKSASVELYSPPINTQNSQTISPEATPIMTISAALIPGAHLEQQQSLLPNMPTRPVTPGGTSTADHPRPSTGDPGPGRVTHGYFPIPAEQHQQPSANTGSGSRPILPLATTHSAHIRQRSNPEQTATATHHQPPTAAAAGSQPTTSTHPSQPTTSAQTPQRSDGLAAPTPQRPVRREEYTSVKNLRPTFSPAIVRTPNHYRHDFQPVVPSPRVAPWDDASPNAGVSTSANKHLSGAMQGVVPSPRVLPPRNAATRMYEMSTRPTQSVQRFYSIPEPPRPMIPVSRQNSKPTVPTGPDSHDHLVDLSSIGNLPQFAEEPDPPLSPLVVSESSTSTTVLAESPPPLFIPPRYSRSPSPSSPRHWRSRAVSPSSSSSSSPPPQERRDPGFSLPPPQQPKPPRGSYRRTVRYGFWNRRGDYLTMDKYVVYAPHDRANPQELKGYPAPSEGFKDHFGNFVKYDPSLRELPESLPRQGLPPVLPYEKVGTRSPPLPPLLIYFSDNTDFYSS